MDFFSSPLGEADAKGPRRVLEDDQRLMEPLEADITGADARDVVRRKLRRPDLGLQFPELVVQGAKAAFVEAFDEQGGHGEKAVRDVLCRRRDTLPLDLDFAHAPTPLVRAG